MLPTNKAECSYKSFFWSVGCIIVELVYIYVIVYFLLCYFYGESNLFELIIPSDLT